MKHQFTREQLVDFDAYERVRSSGQFNMLTRQAQHATGLDRDRYVYVMEHFDALQDAANKRAMSAPA